MNEDHLVLTHINNAHFLDTMADEQQTKYTAATKTNSPGILQTWGNSTAIIILVVSFLLINVLHLPNEIETALKEKYSKIDEIDLEQYLPKSMSLKQIPFISPSIKVLDGFESTNHLLNVAQFLETVVIQGDVGPRVAVIGRPGVGKSTLARHIAKLWAQGSTLQDIKMLFHICLGKSSTTISDVQQLLEEDCHNLDLLEDFDIEVQHLVNKMKVSKGRGVAFILDGFDEYFPKEKK